VGTLNVKELCVSIGTDGPPSSIWKRATACSPTRRRAPGAGSSPRGHGTARRARHWLRHRVPLYLRAGYFAFELSRSSCGRL